MRTGEDAHVEISLDVGSVGGFNMTQGGERILYMHVQERGNICILMCENRFYVYIYIYIYIYVCM